MRGRRGQTYDDEIVQPVYSTTNQHVLYQMKHFHLLEHVEMATPLALSEEGNISAGIAHYAMGNQYILLRFV